MKAVPLIVLAVLVILPFTIRFFYTIPRLSTKDSDAATQTPATTPEKYKLRPVLAYTAAALYFMLLIAAIFWTFFSFAADLGLLQGNFPYIAIFTTIIILAGNSVGLFLWLRYARKKISFPNKEATPEARLEWENKYADLYSKNLLRMLLLHMGFALFVAALLAITVYYFA